LHLCVWPLLYGVFRAGCGGIECGGGM